MSGIWTTFVTTESLAPVLGPRDVDIVSTTDAVKLVHYRGVPIGVQLTDCADESASLLGRGAHPSIILRGDESVLQSRWIPTGEVPDFCQHGFISGVPPAGLRGMIMLGPGRHLVAGAHRWSPFRMGLVTELEATGADEAAGGYSTVGVDEEVLSSVGRSGLLGTVPISARGAAALREPMVTIVAAHASPVDPLSLPGDVRVSGPEGTTSAVAIEIDDDRWVLVAELGR